MGTGTGQGARARTPFHGCMALPPGSRVTAVKIGRFRLPKRLPEGILLPGLQSESRSLDECQLCSRAAQPPEVRQRRPLAG